MKTNKKILVANGPTTAPGAPANRISHEQSLTRSVMSCMLFEQEAYEDGVTVASRIADLVGKCEPQFVADLALRARSQMHLRHVPLLLCRELARQGTLRASWLERCIQRADEMAEFLALYYKGNGEQPLSNPVKKGIAAAFYKFSEHQFGKYKGQGNAWSLRDALRLTHPRPRNAEESEIFRRIAAKELATPDTWETELSAGKNKRETFERLILEGKLGYFALLRNLRNMIESGVNDTVIRNAILARRGGADKILPFRFIAAAKHAPKFADALDSAMLANVSAQPKLSGKTVIVVDVSGSMGSMLSLKSDMSRMDAAAALAAIARERFEHAVVYATGGDDYRRTHATTIVPSYRGLALAKAVVDARNTTGSGGIFLTQVCKFLSTREQNVARMIVVSDEQDCAIKGSEDSPLKANPLGSYKNYFINVASAQNGISYDKNKWDRIDGFSESIFDFLLMSEQFEGTINGAKQG